MLKKQKGMFIGTNFIYNISQNPDNEREINKED